MDKNIRGNIIIRDFRTEEYRSLVKMWKEADLPYKPEGRDSREKLEAELGRGIGSLLVAELNGTLCGSVLVTHDGRKGWINRLAVLPDLRRRGLAERLISEAQKRLDREGIEITAALIEDDNPSSAHFFRKLGFVEHCDITYFTRRKCPGV